MEKPVTISRSDEQIGSDLPHPRTGDNVLLFEGPVRWHKGTESGEAPARLEVIWKPRPLVTCTFEKPPDQMYVTNLAGEPQIELQGFRYGWALKYMESNSVVGVKTLVGRILRRLDPDTAGKANAVRFYLPGGFDSLYFGIMLGPEGKPANVSTLKVELPDGWTLSVSPIRKPPHDDADERDVDKHARFTIVCLLQRTNGEDFDRKRATNVLELVMWALLFADGKRVYPALPTFLDKTGNTLDTDFSDFVADEPERFPPWSTVSGNGWADVLAGLMSLDYANSMSVKRAIWLWHCASMNSSFPEIAAIMIGSALELLSWVIVVERGNYVSEGAFGTMKPEDQLRLACRIANVGTDIAWSDVPELTVLQEDPWKIRDIPRLACELRNVFVHQSIANRTKREKLSSRALYRGYRLANLCAEHLTLYLLNGKACVELSTSPPPPH
jgi:hypothetical protein